MRCGWNSLRETENNLTIQTICCKPWGFIEQQVLLICCFSSVVGNNKRFMVNSVQCHPNSFRETLLSSVSMSDVKREAKLDYYCGEISCWWTEELQKGKMPISLGKCYFALCFENFALYFTFMNHKEYRHILRMLLMFSVISPLVELVGHMYDLQDGTDCRLWSSTNFICYGSGFGIVDYNHWWWEVGTVTGTIDGER